MRLENLGHLLKRFYRFCQFSNYWEINTRIMLAAVLWIRISINPQLFWSAKSGSGWAKITHKKRKKRRNVIFLKCWMFSLRAGGFFCYLDVLYEGLRKNTIHCNFWSKKYEIFSIFQICFSNPWIRVENLIRTSIEKQMRVHNTGFLWHKRSPVLKVKQVLWWGLPLIKMVPTLMHFRWSSTEHRTRVMITASTEASGIPAAAKFSP